MTGEGEARRRREPPAFRRVEVTHVEQRSPTLTRVRLSGPALEGFVPDAPAASARLLLPRPDAGPLELPVWNGNEFLEADGRRPVLRTITPLDVDPAAHHLDVEVVLHGEAPLSRWARFARPGDGLAVSGPGSGYAVDPSADDFLLVGDESALPAIGQLLLVLPARARVRAVIEIRDSSARLDLPSTSDARIDWYEASGGAPGDAMVDAVRSTTIAGSAHVWAAGEAAAVHRLRRHLFDDVGLTRARATVRGYWKHGRDGTT